jgi:RNA polymerase sigma factor for flagellar operon FliA
VAGAHIGGVSEDLATYARTRDPELRGALAVRHLPLAKFVARKMSANLPSNIELDDLVSWGSLGLLDALDKFDPSKGVQFSTYAVTRIRGAILDGLQQMDWAPKQVTSKVRAVRRLREVLTNELGREPSVEELAYRMDVTPAEVRGWLVDDSTTRLKPLSPAYDDDDEGRDGYGAIEADQAIAGEAAEIRCRVAAAVRRLGDREQAVFLLYYRENLTLREIASELGVSVSSATQTHTRLVEQVRGYLAAFGAVA